MIPIEPKNTFHVPSSLYNLIKNGIVNDGWYMTTNGDALQSFDGKTVIVHQNKLYYLEKSLNYGSNFDNHKAKAVELGNRVITEINNNALLTTGAGRLHQTPSDNKCYNLIKNGIDNEGWYITTKGDALQKPDEKIVLLGPDGLFYLSEWLSSCPNYDNDKAAAVRLGNKAKMAIGIDAELAARAGRLHQIPMDNGCNSLFLKSSSDVTVQKSYVKSTQAPLPLSKYGRKNDEKHVSHVKNKQLRSDRASTVGAKTIVRGLGSERQCASSGDLEKVMVRYSSSNQENSVETECAKKRLKDLIYFGWFRVVPKEELSCANLVDVVAQEDFTKDNYGEVLAYQINQNGVLHIYYVKAGDVVHSLSHLTLLKYYGPDNGPRGEYYMFRCPMTRKIIAGSDSGDAIAEPGRDAIQFESL